MRALVMTSLSCYGALEIVCVLLLLFIIYAAMSLDCICLGFLNWWADIELGPRLYPLQTSGDGNCLLHAASLGPYRVLVAVACNK